VGGGGHGTGLSGGALPVPNGVLISLSRMTAIRHVDIENQYVVAEPGVTNLEITRRVAPFGYYYAPDPSSQVVCSIGGNVAENSGGAHCLKYGFTVHHVLGVEAVLADGDVARIGGPSVDPPGLDLLGVLVGSEGTLAVVTEVTVRILRRPEAVLTLLAGFPSIDAAGAAVSAIIGCGIVPAAVEMMDRLTIDAAEASVHPNFPPSNAVLIVELDGPDVEVRELFATVEGVCRSAGAETVEIAHDAGARGSPRSCAAFGSWRPDRDSASATCFTPAMATCIRSFATTSPSPARPSTPSAWPRRFSSTASTPADH
jgi:glycolate dehydrogenase FAD-linked subunit